MSGDRTLLNRVQVAARLGHNIAWFYKNYSRLSRAGFPQPVLGGMRGARWDPAAIDRWLDSRLPATKAKRDNLAIISEQLLAEETGELERRARALA